MEHATGTGELVARLLSEALERADGRVVPWTDTERALLSGMERAGLVGPTERGQPVQDQGPRFTPLHATLTEEGRTAGRRLAREPGAEERTARLGRVLAQGRRLGVALRQCRALR